jgi:hypothetical protein
MTAFYFAIAGLGAVGLLALLHGLAQRRRGQTEANSKSLEAAVDTARKSGAIDEEVGHLSDDDLDRELHDNGRR